MSTPVQARSRTEVLDRKLLPAAREVFHQGDAADCAWIVQSGRVMVVRDGPDGPVKLGTIGPGEIFGEMALVDQAPRMATAVTVEPTVIVPVPRAVFLRKLAKADPFLARLVRILVQNVRSMTNQYIETLEGVSEATEKTPAPPPSSA